MNAAGQVELKLETPWRDGTTHLVTSPLEFTQVGLFATRTRCHALRSNQLRMLLAALGYVLIERLRALALQGTALAAAEVDTLRIKLLKVAAAITRNTRRIRLYLASRRPSAGIFAHAMSQLRSP